RQDNKFRGTEKGDFALQMPEAKEGLYTCDVSGKEKSIRLHVLKVTGFPEGYLLQGESLELQLHPPNMAPTPIEWIGPQNEKGHQPRWNRMDNGQRLQIKNLQIQDDGIWKCSAHGLTISYKVTVLGFVEDLDAEIFAAVDNMVTLSYKLSSPAEKNPNIMEVLLTKEALGKSTSLSSASDSCSPQTIPKVQFEDGGRYQCHLKFSRGWLNRTIHLIVMKASATPPGPLPKEGTANLCCSISAPLPLGAVLRWDAGNKSSTVPHCLMVQKAGQQTCRLTVGKEEKIVINYTMEEATEQTGFPLFGLALGVGGPLVLLVLLSMCLFVYVAIKRKKRRMERMAQAKQHLLAKRTCQCQRDKSNDYYHT
ncbi:UNVERIFIED_CONTAM: hypothetical protein K2H54_021713, partial [Gekko kuhli]